MADKHEKGSSVSMGKDVEFVELVTFKNKARECEYTVAAGKDGRITLAKSDGEVLVAHPDEWYEAMEQYQSRNANLKIHKN